jgi:hypothetical protein
MPPSERAVLEFVQKLVPNALSGNSKARCKCYGKEATTNLAPWFNHRKENCDGNLDTDLLEHAQAAADKEAAKRAKKCSNADATDVVDDDDAADDVAAVDAVAGM